MLTIILSHKALEESRMNKLRSIYGDGDFPMEIDVPYHCEDGEEDFAYFEILSIDEFEKVNRLAAEFYSMYGYVFLPEMDFQSSTHPQEQACFMRACQSYYLVNKGWPI